jgi:hypothetical protein
MGRNGPTAPTGCGAGSLIRRSLGCHKKSAGYQIRTPGKQDLARVRKAWDEWQAKRDRDAIYCSLTAVFDLVVGDAKMHRRAGSLQLRPITMNLRRHHSGDR